MGILKIEWPGQSDNGRSMWGNRLQGSLSGYQANLFGVAEAMGSESAARLRDAKDTAAEYYRARAADQGAVSSFKDVDGIGSALNYVGGLAVDSLPYMGEMLVGGMAGRGLALGTRVAGNVSAELGIQSAVRGSQASLGRASLAGGAAASYPSAVGDILSNQREQSGEMDLLSAGALGVPYAALNITGVGELAARARLPRLVEGRAAQYLDNLPGIRGGATRAGYVAGKVGLQEGLSETGQEFINQAGRNVVDPNAGYFGPEALDRYAESFVGGAALGGVMGGAAGGWRRSEGYQPKDMLNRDVPPATGGLNESGPPQNRDPYWNLYEPPVTGPAPQAPMTVARLYGDETVGDPAINPFDDYWRVPGTPAGAQPAPITEWDPVERKMVPVRSEETGQVMRHEMSPAFPYDINEPDTGSVMYGANIPYDTGSNGESNLSGAVTANDQDAYASMDLGARVARQQIMERLAQQKQAEDQNRKIAEETAQKRAKFVEDEKRARAQIMGGAGKPLGSKVVDVFLDLERQRDAGIITPDDFSSDLSLLPSKLGTVRSRILKRDKEAGVKKEAPSVNQPNVAAPAAVAPGAVAPGAPQPGGSFGAVGRVAPDSAGQRPAAPGAVAPSGGAVALAGDGTGGVRTGAVAGTALPEEKAPVDRKTALAEAKVEIDPATGAKKTVLPAVDPKKSSNQGGPESEGDQAFRRTFAERVKHMREDDRMLLTGWLGVELTEDGDLELAGGGASLAKLGEGLRDQKTGKMGISKEAVRQRLRKIVAAAGAPANIDMLGLYKRLGYQLSDLDLETLERNAADFKVDKAGLEDLRAAKRGSVRAGKTVEEDVALQEQAGDEEVSAEMGSMDRDERTLEADETTPEAYSEDDRGDAPTEAETFDEQREARRQAENDDLTEDLKEGRVTQDDVVEAQIAVEKAMGPAAWRRLSNGERTRAVRMYASARLRGDPTILQIKKERYEREQAITQGRSGPAVDSAAERGTAPRDAGAAGRESPVDGGSAETARDQQEVPRPGPAPTVVVRKKRSINRDVLDGDALGLVREVTPETRVLIGHASTQLSEAEQQTLAKHYGAEPGTDEFVGRLAEDVVAFVTKGAQAVAGAVRSIVSKVARAVLAVAVVFNVGGLNPQFSSEAYARTAAQAQQTPITKEVQFKQQGKADYNGRLLSVNARKVVDWIAAQNRPSELSLILDPATGRLYVMKGPKIVADAPALFGKKGVAAIDDRIRNAHVDDYTDDMKVTPAGRFPLKKEASNSYGSTITFLEGDPGTGSVFAVHQVYLGNPAERRAERLNSNSPLDNAISFGCVNVSREFYEGTLAKYDYTGGAFGYFLPSDPATLDSVIPRPDTALKTSVTSETANRVAAATDNPSSDLDFLERRRARATRAGRRPKFSKEDGAAEGSTVASLRKEIAKLGLRDPNGRVVIVQSVDDLPINAQVVQDKQSETGGRVQGFVFNGRVYLVADNIRPGKGRSVFMHEVGSHLGLDNLLSPGQFNRLVKRVLRWADKNDGSLESKLARKALERAGAANTPDEDLHSEILAYFIEEAVDAGIEPTKAGSGPAGLVQWLQDVARAFKASLERLMRSGVKDFSAQDVVDLAYGAAGLELVMGDGSPGPMFSANVPRLFYTDRWIANEGPYGSDLRHPVTTSDGLRLDGFTDRAQTTFKGYDKNGERITIRRDYVDPSSIIRSRDGGRTAEAVRQALTQIRAASAGASPVRSANPDIKFSVTAAPSGKKSLADLPPPSAKLGGLKGLVQNLSKDGLWRTHPGLLGWLSGEQLAEQFGKLPLVGDAVKAFADLSSRMAGRAMQIKAQGDALLTRWDTLRSKDATSAERLDKLLNLSTEHRIWPQHGFRDKENLHVEDTPENRATHAKLQAMWNGAGEPVRQLYRDLIADGETRYKAKVAALRSSIVSSFYPTPDSDGLSLTKEEVDRAADTKSKDWPQLISEIGTSPRKLKELRHLRDDLEEHDGQFKRAPGPYFPLMRFGKHIVAIKSAAYQAAEKAYLQAQEALRKAEGRANPDADLAEERKAVKDALAALNKLKASDTDYRVDFFETIGEARQWREDATAQLGDGYTVQQTIKDEYLKQVDAVSPTFMRRLEQKLSSAFEGEKGEQIRLAVREMYLQMLPEQHMLKAQLKRKSVAGYNEDAMRTYAASVVRDSHGISRLEFQAPLRDALDKLRFDRYNVDAKIIGGELAKRLEMNFKYEEHPLLSGLTNVTYMWRLGLSPSFLLTNLTQPWFVSAPIIAARHHFKTFGELKTASVAAAKMLYADKKGQDTWRFQFDPDRALKAGEITQDEALMLKRMLESGRVDITITQDLGAAADGKELGWLSKATQIAGLPAQQLEVLNRVATALAAYRLERQHQLAKNVSNAQALDEAYKYADRMVAETHLNYSAENRARHMHPNTWGGWGRVMWQFRAYQQGMIYLVLKNLQGAAKGDKEAQKAVAYLSGTMLATAGVSGLPGAAAVFFLAQALYGAFEDDDEEKDLKQMLYAGIENTLGATAADAIMKGAPTLAGMDISGKVGMGDLFAPVRFGPDHLNPKDQAMGYFGAAVGGASVGLLGDFWKAANLAADGKVAQAAQAALPKVVSDQVRMAREQTEGVTDSRGRVLITPEERDFMDAVARAAGIPTVEDSRRAERRQALFEARENRDTVRNDLLSKFAQARISGKPVDDVLADIKSFNERHPDARITPANRESAVRSTRSRSKELRNGVPVRKQDQGLAAELGV